MIVYEPTQKDFDNFLFKRLVKQRLRKQTDAYAFRYFRKRYKKIRRNLFFAIK